MTAPPVAETAPLVGAGARGGRYLDPVLETMSRDQLDAYRTSRLLNSLQGTYERSPLIRWAWGKSGVRPEDIKTLADFETSVPFINKDSLREYRDERGDAYSGLGAGPSPSVWGAQSTSGTTSDPTLLPFFDRHSVETPGSYTESFARAYWELGVRPGDFVAMTLFTFRGPVWANPQRIGATPVFFNHGSELGRLLDIGQRLRPSCLFLLSQAMIFELAEMAEAKDAGVREWLASTPFIYGGEPLGARAAFIAGELGMKLYQHTAVGDIAVATECLEQNGCHIPEDQVFLEHLAPESSARVAGGEVGEMVVTSIGDGIPLVRYRSDDLVRVGWDSCGCGRSHARIWPVGRVTDGVVVKAVRVMPADVWRCVESVPETRNGLFQIIASGKSMESLRLRVGKGDASTRSSDDIVSALTGSLEAAIGVPVEIDLVSEESLLRLGPPHKIPRIVKA
ncbi:phenylacetate--CoA ligase family protein [Arthrobacter sp. PAMC25564]|uniref:phenylacetate--CoA ligase family protein n=1 Tax=Arthrobacter sp. PAMC25564 TaxID=2565366 RepID=UPI0010A21656|nr:phenylacetate--CoA ligase family protein [Arthrobacter sp. PAMC25564]QCB97971.1 phenylacetate--CoA ligase family protein [Arthrobacter sp. PAMC25564]